jgi:hypothetical protein
VAAICDAYACRVQVTGGICQDDDKFCGRQRKVWWMVDAESILHEFACWCAEQALTYVGVTDERCWNAIRAKRQWLAGDLSTKDLCAAGRVAEEAAGGFDSDSEDAAYAAASAATIPGTESARYAVDAARVCEALNYDALNAQLEKMLRAAHKKRQRKSKKKGKS